VPIDRKWIGPWPWDVWPYEPAIHLMLFVHRVEGMTPGLYMLVRDPKKLPFIQQSMNPQLTWTPVPGCPEELPLYWLLEGDAKKTGCAGELPPRYCWRRRILVRHAGRVRGALAGRGAWWYPRLFWESGLLGQVLYLEAEAAGVRATGIGCFFDDPVHEIVAVKGLASNHSITLRSADRWRIGG